MKLKKITAISLVLAFAILFPISAFARWEGCMECCPPSGNPIGRYVLTNTVLTDTKTSYSACPLDGRYQDRMVTRYYTEYYNCDNCGALGWTEEYTTTSRNHDHPPVL